MLLNIFSNLLLLSLSNIFTVNANLEDKFITSIQGCSFENLNTLPGYSADIYSYKWSESFPYYQTSFSNDQYESDLITTFPVVSNPNFFQDKNYESLNIEFPTTNFITQLSGYFFGMSNFFFSISISLSN